MKKRSVGRLCDPDCVMQKRFLESEMGVVEFFVTLPWFEGFSLGSKFS